MSTRVALVGCGAWGKNFARVLREAEGATLSWVVDLSPDVRAFWSRSTSVAETLDDAVLSSVDAVIVATPADAHFAAARRCLERGRALLVEKPLVSSVKEAHVLLEVARRQRSIAMVGHLMRFHPAIRRAVSLVRGGAIGPLQSLISRRFSAAPAGTTSAFWELLPHDLSIVHMLGEAPDRPLSRSESGGRSEVTGSLSSGASLSVSLSRAHPAKVRTLAFVGRDGSIELDDVGDPFGLVLRGRGGGASRVAVVPEEPLAGEVRSFLSAVRGESPLETPLAEGALVVEWMERAEPPPRAEAVAPFAFRRPLQARPRCLTSARDAGCGSLLRKVGSSPLVVRRRFPWPRRSPSTGSAASAAAFSALSTSATSRTWRSWRSTI